MANIIRNTTNFAMHTIKEYIRPDSTVVDATCGNGHDTLKLAQCGPRQLYAFDIQPQAVQSTTERLINGGFESALTSGSIKVICSSHTDLNDYVKTNIDAAVFNLGYLPGSDKTVTTCPDTTTAAVFKCLDKLNPGGIVSVIMYSGHPGGKEEKNALVNAVRKLDSSRFHAAYINMLNQPSDPPEILFITKK